MIFTKGGYATASQFLRGDRKERLFGETPVGGGR